MGKLTVLVVDDHSVTRDGLMILIRSQNDLEVLASSGTAHTAPAVSAKLKPDVVIIHLGTRARCLSTARIVRRHSPRSKVLVLSSANHNGLLRATTKNGLKGVISRHTPTSRFLRVIREVARGKSYVDEGIPGARNVKLDVGSSAQSARRITAREAQVLKLIAEGLLNKQIANELCLSIKTVEKHRQALMDRLNIHNVALLTRYALAKGLIDPQSVRSPFPVARPAPPAS